MLPLTAMGCSIGLAAFALLCLTVGLLASLLVSRSRID